jgi:hypothetical protein
MMKSSFVALAVFAQTVVVTHILGAQNPPPSSASSSSAAQDLSRLLTERKLDAIATRDPGESDRYVAALFYPESQLLVITARYIAPVLLDAKLANKQYRDVYVDLHGASVQASKIFFQDVGADGLHPDEDHAIDLLYEAGVAKTIVDKDADERKHGSRGGSVVERFAAADARYTRLLKLLIDELRKAG